MTGNSYILIVEDSPTQARQVESILEQLGCRISIASNGNEALNLVRNERPLIIIADILMPEMNGYQLCRTIKSEEMTRDIPVILLTQLSDPKEIIKGLECGADDFIVKPFNEELLLASIQATISSRLKKMAVDKEMNVLVVEDSPTQAEQLRHLLEESGYSVFVAGNGKEGLDLARRTKPALIISDVLMPEMDGYEFAYELKHDSELRKIPLILVTSMLDKKDILRRASVVADGYFTKPYDDSFLIQKVKTLITGMESAGDASVQEPIEVNFGGENYRIASDRRQILNFLLSTYESAVPQNKNLLLMQRELQKMNEQLEEKIAERTEQMRASEENFRALAKNAFDGIVVVTGADARFVFVNQRVNEIAGYSIAEMMSMTIKDIVHPEDLPTVAGRYRKRLEGKNVTEQYEIRIITKDGRVVPVELTAARTIWHGESASITIVRDVSERKKREEELTRASKLESLGVLAGGIAHDFNNLLTGIVGNASLAKMRSDPEDRIYTILTNLENASMRAKDLTQQLLTFAKGGAPVKKTVSIAEVIKDSANFAVSGSNTNCDITIADNLWPVEADEGQISQVIHNLVINAKQSMPGGGTIRISVENAVISTEDISPIKEGRYVKLTIRDSGVGIPESHLLKIFDPYFTTKQQGSGLGLSTVYSIIKNHNGYISVASQAGAGTTFSIHLPVSEKEPSATGFTGITLQKGSGRILLMDDEEIVREVAKEMLAELGYEAGFARDGKEAIDLYKEAMASGRPFDVVIMDLTIPGGMGGKEAILDLLQIDPGVKAVVSSGYSDDAVMSDWLHYGFSAVIAKPYRISELSSVIHQVAKG